MTRPGVVELLTPMQKVVGSVCLEIDVFWRNSAQFFATVCWSERARFAKRARPIGSEK
jgi:hypothetical protein